MYLILRAFEDGIVFNFHSFCMWSHLPEKKILMKWCTEWAKLNWLHAGLSAVTLLALEGGCYLSNTIQFKCTKFALCDLQHNTLFLNKYLIPFTHLFQYIVWWLHDRSFLPSAWQQSCRRRLGKTYDWHEMTWNDMKWDEMTWNDMKYEMTYEVTYITWNDMIWPITKSSVKWNDMKWHEMTWNDMKWHEMTWNDLKWHEMTWNDMKWCLMTWNDMNDTILPIPKLALNDSQRHSAPTCLKRLTRVCSCEGGLLLKWLLLRKLVLDGICTYELTFCREWSAW
jgi:hypothetical protein